MKKTRMRMVAIAGIVWIYRTVGMITHQCLNNQLTNG